MLPLERLTRTARPEAREPQAGNRVAVRRLTAALAVPITIFAIATTGIGAGGKILLTRKYRAGETTAYETKVKTTSQVESTPETLKSLFPPIPASMSVNQKSTVTVIRVDADGAADVQNRFDRFDVQSDLSSIPDNDRESINQVQKEVGQRIVGQKLTAHYDHVGRLVDMEGTDELFRDIDPPVRDPVLQMLRMFMEQMGGQSLFPDHPVQEGDEWTQNLDAEPAKDYPYQVRGKSIWHYVGKTRYQGFKAAILDYHVENTLTPAMENIGKGGETQALESMGKHVDAQITGKGQGRILVALDDGRVLQNHSSLHQTLSAMMKGAEGLVGPTTDVPHLEIQSDTELEVDGSKP